MESSGMDLLIMKEPISRLQAVEDAAVQALDFGDHDRALFLRMQALALAKLCMDDPNVAEKDTILARAHLQLSATYLGMGFGDQAYWHAQRDPSNALIHEAFGDLFVFAKDSDAPLIENDVHGMKRSNKRHSGGKSPKSPKTPTSPTNSLQVGAMDEANQDLYERGLSYFEKAWELVNKSVNGTVKKSGKKVTIHPALAQLYGKIAKTKTKQGSDDEAADMYEKAISSYEKAAVPNASGIAHLNYELGCTYHRLKKYSEATSALDKASKFCEEQKDIGRSDPLSFVIQKEQGITMYDKGDYIKAKAIFEELLQLQHREYGSGSVVVAETLKYLGDCGVGLNEMADACHLYSRAVRIMKRKYGVHDPNVRELVAYIRQLNLGEEDQNQD